MEIRLKQHIVTINPGQNKLYWSLINATDWEPESFKIFDYFTNEHSEIIDIGAWSGILSLYAAKRVKTVHAIDPDPVCYEELKENILLNPDISEKIKTYQEAISDKKEIVNLSARQNYGASSTSILKRKRDSKTNFEIETISLYDFIKTNNISNIDFIKMDVEGAEFKILSNIKKTIEMLNYPTLFVSFHHQFLNESLYNKYVPTLFLNKLLMKIEQHFNFNFFAKFLKNKIKKTFKNLDGYKYIYTTFGEALSIAELQKKPSLIKNHDLVFTNTKWH